MASWSIVVSISTIYFQNATVRFLFKAKQCCWICRHFIQ